MTTYWYIFFVLEQPLPPKEVIEVIEEFGGKFKEIKFDNEFPPAKMIFYKDESFILDFYDKGICFTFLYSLISRPGARDIINFIEKLFTNLPCRFCLAYGENLEEDFWNLLRPETLAKSDIPPIITSPTFLSKKVAEKIGVEKILKLPVGVVKKLENGGYMIVFDKKEPFATPPKILRKVNSHLLGITI